MVKILDIPIPAINTERLGEVMQVELTYMFEEVNEQYVELLRTLVDIENVSFGEFTLLKQAMEQLDRYKAISQYMEDGTMPRYYAYAIQTNDKLNLLNIQRDTHSAYIKLINRLALITEKRNTDKTNRLNAERTRLMAERGKQMELMFQIKSEQEQVKTDLLRKKLSENVIEVHVTGEGSTTFLTNEEMSDL